MRSASLHPSTQAARERAIGHPSGLNAQPLRVAVIGAGPVGLSMALHLQRLGAGVDVTVFDAMPDPNAALADPRVLALSEGSRQLLAAAGAWPDAAATAITRIHVSQAAPGLAALPRVWLSAQEAGLPALGYTLRYGELLKALQAAALHAGIRVQYGQPMHALPAEGGVLLRQASAEDEGPRARAQGLPAESPAATCELALLAEGGAFHTQTPRALRHDYHQTALVGRVRCDRPHAGLAFERFTADGPVALLPCGAAHALVWCVAPAQVEILRGMDNAAQIAALQARLPAACGRVVELQITGSYPLGLNAAWHARQGRIVQLGNAAQTLHPVAGQGLNLGLRDAATLGQWLGWTLAQSPHPNHDLDALLLRYDRARLPDRAALVSLTDLLARGFTWQAPGSAAIRAGFLASLALLPPLRQMLQDRMVFGWRT